MEGNSFVGAKKELNFTIGKNDKIDSWRALRLYICEFITCFFSFPSSWTSSPDIPSYGSPIASRSIYFADFHFSDWLLQPAVSNRKGFPFQFITSLLSSSLLFPLQSQDANPLLK